MRVVDFFNLERSLQERFVEAVRGSVPPTALAFASARRPRGVLAWWALAWSAVVGVVAVVALGFGALDSRFALLGRPFIGVLAGLLALFVFSGLRAMALDHERDSLPYRAGAYVFPVGVVDAPSGVIHVHYFADLSEVTCREHRVFLLFEGGVRFEFEMAAPALAEELVLRVEQHRQRSSGDVGPPSSRELAGLDPLADTGFKSPFTPTERLRPSSPRWLRLGWLEAVLVGALLGPLVWWGRNFVSEERLYTKARELGTTAGYRAYLERGGVRPDVTKILLPHAELQQAIAQKSVRAIEAFMARGKFEQIASEVQVALKQALLNELNEVAAKNSVTALQVFEDSQRHSKLVRKELELKRAELYQKAARAFTAVAAQNSSGLVGAFGRLLYYAQSHGPEVEVAFRRRAVESSKDAEAQLTKSAYFMGQDALPSRYFRPEDWERREAEVGHELTSRLNREFPADILHFKLVAAIQDDGTDLPKFDKPTLLITHRSELSGAFMCKKPRGAFVGLGLMVRSVLSIPGDDAPLSFKFSAWLPPDLRKWEEPGATPQDIYEGLARDGFSRYTKKQLAFWLKAP